MSIEENKAIVRRWNDELFKGNPDIIDELAAASYVNHDIGDREAFKRYRAELGAAFSDMSIAIEDTIAEGDKVVSRWTMSWTHTGEFRGISATGKQATFSGMSIHRIEGGKVVEDWSNSDSLGLMQQLGVIPPMGGE